MCLLRLLEFVFFLYFATHIPITILFDSQVVASDFGIPMELYPEQVLNLTKQYVAQFKDPYMLSPPLWYKSFCFAELILQLPFFFVAAPAFLLGSRQWIRIPAIIYSAHVTTVVGAIIYSFAYDNFSKMGRVGPATQEERLRLIAVYAPYFVIPLLILLTMLLSTSYVCGPSKAPELKQANQQKKKQQHYKSH